MRRVLVLTAGFGEGHNSAARHVCEALKAESGVLAAVHDPLVSYGEIYESEKRRYLAVIGGAPWLWRIGYHALDKLPVAQVSAMLLGKAEALLEKTLAESGADTAVCTYPLYPWLLRRISRRTGKRVKVVTIVTDSIAINRAWAIAPSDLWLTAERFSARRLAGLGAPREKIVASGFPVSAKFGEAEPTTPRRAPSAGEPARILLVAGTAPRQTEACALTLASLPGVKLSVAVGRDAALGEAVTRTLASANLNADLIGWTDKMPELLRSHHIVLGKAGGATTHETLAARTPFLITRVLPGQEEGNAELITRIGAGEVVKSPEDAARAVSVLLEDDAKQWERRVDNISRFSHPHGARRAARAILALH